jgi:hypothetical protein
MAVAVVCNGVLRGTASDFHVEHRVIASHISTVLSGASSSSSMRDGIASATAFRD